MKYQVYIERCRDNSPRAPQELADAIAARFGVSSADILSRLEQGRFRIKTNLDLERAKSFMSYLEANGALCSILDGSGMGVARSSALRGAKPRAESQAIEVKTMDIPRVALADLELEPALQLESEPPLELDPTHIHKSAAAPEQDPAHSHKSATSPELDPTHVHKSAEAPPVTFRTQKSAAAPELDPTHVHKSAVAGGAASGRQAGIGSMQLSTLDGVDPTAHLANTTQSEQDFLPPDMAQEEELLEVEQAPQAPARTAREVSAQGESPAHDVLELQPYSDAVSTPTPPDRATQSDMVVGGTAQAGAKSGPLEFLANNMRPRFAVGIALSLLLGLLIMSPIASTRESGRYDEPIKLLAQSYAEADTVLAWESLDARRTETTDTLKSRRSSLVVTSLMIWMVLSGLLAFLWLRVVDWSRWETAS